MSAFPIPRYLFPVCILLLAQRVLHFLLGIGRGLEELQKIGLVLGMNLTPSFGAAPAFSGSTTSSMPVPRNAWRALDQRLVKLLWM